MYGRTSREARRPRRSRRSILPIVAVLALVVLALNGPAFAAGKIPPEPPANRVPVTICHQVNGNGNTGNGYNLITVDASSIVKAGHLNHEGDIIPPFTYFTLEGTGQNKFWQEHNFAGQGDASLIATNCASSGPSDVCPDIAGDQTDPAECPDPDDVCPDIPGTQTDPAECPEPEDVCPDVPGDQTDPAECPEPEDVCPDVPGDQTDPAECSDPGSGGSEPSAGPIVLGEQASTGGSSTAGGQAGARGAASSNAPAVPTDVDAGLGSPASSGSGEALLASGLVALGLLLMACAGLPSLRQPRRGADPA
jgi:hypothetical protein